MINKILPLFRNNALPRVEFRPSGRLLELVYVTKDAESIMSGEMSGSNKFDILAHTETLKSWSNGNPLTEEEKSIILRSFKSWEKNSTMRVQW